MLRMAAEPSPTPLAQLLSCSAGQEALTHQSPLSQGQYRGSMTDPSPTPVCQTLTRLSPPTVCANTSCHTLHKDSPATHATLHTPCPSDHSRVTYTGYHGIIMICHSHSVLSHTHAHCLACFPHTFPKILDTHLCHTFIRLLSFPT